MYDRRVCMYCIVCMYSAVHYGGIIWETPRCHRYEKKEGYGPTTNTSRSRLREVV